MVWKLKCNRPKLQAATLLNTTRVQKNIFIFWSDFAWFFFQELFSSNEIGTLTLCAAYIRTFEFSNVKIEKRYKPTSQELLFLQVAFISWVKRRVKYVQN